MNSAIKIFNRDKIAVKRQNAADQIEQRRFDWRAVNKPDSVKGQSFILLERCRPNLATYPEGQRATSTLPYLVLLRVRFIKPINYLTAGRLLPCLFILTEKNRRFSFL